MAGSKNRPFALDGVCMVSSGTVLTSMKLESPYRVGLDYEKLSLQVLRGLAFQLKHTGGCGDGGVDFTGHWELSKRTIPVIGT